MERTKVYFTYLHYYINSHQENNIAVVYLISLSFSVAFYFS